MPEKNKRLEQSQKAMGAEVHLNISVAENQF